MIGAVSLYGYCTLQSTEYGVRIQVRIIVQVRIHIIRVRANRH